MIKIYLSLSFSFLFCIVYGQNHTTYSKIKLDLSKTNILDIAALGLETDHGHHAHGKYLVNFYNEAEIKLLKEADISFDILIDNVQDHYEKYGTTEDVHIVERGGEDCSISSARYNYQTPDNYQYGSMGGYLTYTEALANLDRMQELYPNLITTRMPIGNIKTHQDRSLYYLTISNTPGSVDPAKPQILYNALHHAREPNSLSQLLFYMWYLLENYGKDDEVTYLVDHTSMFFLPIINPDGYVYNERTNPNGGGFWRKNRYVNPNGDTVGVDLNRNYGYFWGFDNTGSSSNESSETYRGPSAFSEPETQAVRELCNANNFQIALNYHTFGNLLIHPWGYSDQPTVEDTTFKSLCRVMTIENNFTIGTGTETVGYIVNGDSDDWQYGDEDEKNKIYAMTPEVGPTFWPSENSIDQLNKSSLRHNLNAANLLLNYAVVKEISPTPVVENRNDIFQFELEKSGFINAPVSFSLISESPGVNLSNNIHTNINLTMGQKQIFEIPYEIEDTFNDTIINLSILIDNGDFVNRAEISKIYNKNASNRINTYTNNIENNDEFMASADWGLTEEKFVSPPYAYTDSPNKNYENGVRSEVIFIEPLITDNISEAYLTFQTTYDLELSYDYVQIKVSPDNGPYEDLCGSLTVPGSQFPDGRPIYEGKREWSKESICLNQYLSADELRFKFTFFSDGGVTEDGFYFDDVNYEIINKNVSNTTQILPSLISISPNPTKEILKINILSDISNHNMTYEVYNHLGKKMDQNRFKSNDQTINVSTYPPGLYMLKLFHKGSTIHTDKFIKH